MFLILLLSLSACKENKKNPTKTPPKISTDLHLDHFNIWVENPQEAKAKLTQIGFSAIPDSMSQIHVGQGTTGRYFNFLNTYLELIFVYDQSELEDNNRKNKDLDFTERANFKNNGALPFSIALKMENYDATKIPFEKVRYHQDWMAENQSIYSAKNSKTYLNEPSIFVVYPELKAHTFESLSNLDTIPDEYAFWRDSFKHPNGAQKVTAIQITSTNLDLSSETIQAINAIENITVKNGSEYLMELFFDDHVQGKSFDLRPELPLVMYL